MSKTTENDCSMNGIVENRYRNGKIYKIVCNITGLTYYGSTCKPTLARRLAKHRGCYNRWLKEKTNLTTSYHILKNGNYDIVLVELCPCNSKDELLRRERFHIENNECVNKVIPTQTYQEYRDKNIIEIRKRNIISSQTWRDKNYDFYLKSSRKTAQKYRENNRELVNQKKNVLTLCECGGKYTEGHKSRHMKTEKHLSYTQSSADSKKVLVYI
jgi:hypothetical protein